MLPVPSPEAVSQLAPSGTLRAAINLGNFLLVTAKTVSGDPVGVSPDMAALVADQLGVKLELIGYASPAAIADSAGTNEWDIGNIGDEAARAKFIDFSPAYAQIEATYLVRANSKLATVHDVDQPGVRIVTAGRTAYGLWLEANLKQAELIQVAGLDQSFDAFIDQDADALAGLRVKLTDQANQLAGSRVLDDRFSAVRQAIGVPKGRGEQGAAYLYDLVCAAKQTGLVQQFIDRHQPKGLTVAD